MTRALHRATCDLIKGGVRNHQRLIGSNINYATVDKASWLMDSQVATINVDRTVVLVGCVSAIEHKINININRALIVEIAASTASHDLHDKLDVYRRSGVQEYLVWRVYDEQIDWFALQDGEYIRLTPDASGVIHSQVFPGLRLAVSALLAGEIAQVLAELQKGLGTAEHAEFVKRLGESE